MTTGASPVHTALAAFLRALWGYGKAWVGSHGKTCAATVWVGVDTLQVTNKACGAPADQKIGTRWYCARHNSAAASAYRRARTQKEHTQEHTTT